MQSLRLTLAWVLCAFPVCGCDHGQAVTARNEPADPDAFISPAPSHGKRLCWIQPLKGHPTHQLTQLGFREGCRKLGYEAVIVGTDTYDIAGTIALGEQAIARDDIAGIALWTGSPAYNALIEKAHGLGIPVILPHFPIDEDSAPGATGIISCDPAAFAAECAQKMGERMEGKGVIALTQGSFNTTENMVTATFARVISDKFPKITVLSPMEEGFDTSAAISKAASLLQANANITAALSSTGGGAMVWASAARDSGRSLLIVGMNYTRFNLDLVRNGEVYAVVGQPLWEESYGAVELLDRALRGERLRWWTKLPAPFISRNVLPKYYRLLDDIEATIGY